MEKKEITILLFCLFLVMIGYGLTLPILPFLVEQSAKSNGFLNISPALHVGLMTGIFPLMQFLSAPFWGRWSDRIGRSPVLAAGMGGYALSLILFGWTGDLVLLYMLRVGGGLFSASVLPTVNSWVTDLSPVTNRGKVLAWTGGSASLGVIFGPVLSSFFIDVNWFAGWSWKLLAANTYTVPFIIAGGFSVLALIAVLLWLSDASSQSESNSYQQSNLGFLSITKGEILPILIYALIAQGALSMFESTFALHAQQTLGYSVLEMGFIFMTCGLGMSISQVGLTGFLIDWWGEERLLPIGYLLIGLALFLLMFVNTFILIIVVVSILAVGMALVTPSLASLTSKISEQRVGERMGLLASISSLGLAAGSFLGAGLYSLNIHLPYFLCSSVVLIIFFYMIRRHQNQEVSL
ncbi:MFS transporter, DHA1 family, multidrug resistance protein [Fodinibius salinus]|uniref:MFS transporter, DHA1 family, multidrug resistance protein n=1 Tax=Fodinibius salinus TaxID=860790 RepID=A0A5D3YIB1_9BACT|nr:MFS transporter [Fodinibius salinus]TYP93584.1 MFS transporter, DHA1 family, multidrug resistance protein [Fodinibius salinus]